MEKFTKEQLEFLARVIAYAVNDQKKSEIALEFCAFAGTLAGHIKHYDDDFDARAFLDYFNKVR